MLEFSYLVQMWYLGRAKTMTEQRRHDARASELAPGPVRVRSCVRSRH
jgi:hypothetical protein